MPLRRWREIGRLSARPHYSATATRLRLFRQKQRKRLEFLACVCRRNNHDIGQRDDERIGIRTGQGKGAADEFRTTTGAGLAPPSFGVCDMTGAHSGIVELTDRTLEQALSAADRPLLVSFWTEWCGACHALAPVLDAVAADHGERVTVAKVELERCPIAARTFAIY